jgi:hypothetical protein
MGEDVDGMMIVMFFFFDKVTIQRKVFSVFEIRAGSVS